jgi:RHS repeat-associated protein
VAEFAYTWNERNQLSAASTGTAQTTYTYDAEGRRVALLNNGATTQYVYDGLNVAQQQYSASVADMLPGLNLDEYFTRVDSSGTYAMLGGLFGSVAGLVNSSGALATQYQYSAYGATTATGASSTNPFQYIGRELDPTGLYELRARYYNPIMGRLISPDPMGFAGGQANLPEYSFDAPTDYFDPLGLGCGGGGGGGNGPCTSNDCAHILCGGGQDCPNAPVGRHGGGHHGQAPRHPKAPTDVSAVPFTGQPTLLATSADSIKLAQYLIAGGQPMLNPFQSDWFGVRYGQPLPGAPPVPIYPELSYASPSEPGGFLQLSAP